ncbi:beta-lactamase transpeptidase-like protein [Coniophora puteana RWD-64-598 SS2]|uniref:Beta-lactamase transpeptidase-like protein n=1 Tax=Coniophora puteana (strain RWD-64-598) TaxID=741705 RepID=A0A5M3MNZ7_CONPW|nr:beta-lactamase transpeptidase-like protein [Coniophora puteana RWD-64-598 SS2]EIW80740.1 beta-lactamase transpeptidase-like protein [Coniophora puteana RWD-64-598 SS2]
MASIPDHTKAELDKILRDVTSSEKNRIPGVVFAAVGRDGKPLYVGAEGVRAIGQEAKMTPDTVLWMASLTKAVTGIAALQLIEEGKLFLDDAAQIARLLPELSHVKVVSGSKANGFTYTPVQGGTTLRNLLTHTSGHSYTFFDKKLRDVVGTGQYQDEFSGRPGAFNQPLVHQPNSTFSYGIGIDWVGILIERVTGKKLGTYFDDHILGPLGLQDTAFEVKPHMLPRLSGMHARLSEDTIIEQQHAPIAFAQTNEFHSGGGGLFSTIHDYLMILTIFMNEGKGWNGAQILKPQTVSLATRDNIPSSLAPALDAPVYACREAFSNDIPNIFPGAIKGWGLTFMISKNELPTGRSPGSINWSALCNMFWWVDLKKGVAGMIATQILPFLDAPVLGTLFNAEATLYRGLAESPQFKL